jgi:quercetin dioxygenase-like cupin family protein
MIGMIARFLAASASLLVLLSVMTAAEADKNAVGFELKPVLKSTETNVGGPLTYPNTGKPEITSAIATYEPGGHSNLHQHPVVTFVYVLEGEIDLHVGEQVFHYKAGEAWIEPINVLNQAFNAGSGQAKVLIVFAGEEGKPNAVAAQ